MMKVSSVIRSIQHRASIVMMLRNGKYPEVTIACNGGAWYARCGDFTVKGKPSLASALRALHAEVQSEYDSLVTR
jgi:exosome complex RNA-binding protein Rrp4